MDIEQLRKMKGAVNKTLEAFLNKTKQFNKGTPHDKRLKVSLGDRYNRIYKNLLLNPEIHLKHSERLNKKLLDRWYKIKKLNVDKGLEDWALADKHIKNFTLIHAMSPVDYKLALIEANILREQLLEVVGKVIGISMVSVIECEVVSVKIMRDIAALVDSGKYEKDKQHKLVIMEALAEGFYKANPLDQDDDAGYETDTDKSLFCVHVHGVIFSNKSENFKKFKQELLKNNQWCKAAYQIDLESFSKEYKGEPKDIETNLRDWSRYIVKGGQDWEGGAAGKVGKLHYRYKIGFDTKQDKKYWTENIRLNDLLKTLYKTNKVDYLSLTQIEILELVLFNEALMNSNNNMLKEGYLVTTRLTDKHYN